MLTFVIVERDRSLQYDVLRSVLLGSHGFWSKSKVHLIRVQQTFDTPFNRGLLFNVGFLVANESSHAVFHDVDMIPETTMRYGDTSFPVVQYATRASQFKYQLPYHRYLGGVVGFDPVAFRQINGFSNKFWGWGGEDDDLFRRVKRRHLKVDFPTWGRFLSSEHPRAPRMEHLYQHNLRILGRPIQKVDGLTDALQHCHSVQTFRVSDREWRFVVDPKPPRLHRKL